MAARLKVVFLTPWYPSEENPVYGTFVLEHALAVNHHADVTVVCSTETGSASRPFGFQYGTEYGLPTLRFRFHNTSSLLGKQFWRTWASWHAVRILRQVGCEPDIIHTNVASSALPALVMAWQFKTPAVMTVHETMFARHRLGFIGWYVRTFVNRMQCVMPVTESLSGCLQHHGVRVPLQVVPNAVDLDTFHPGTRTIEGPIDRQEKPWRLLTVGVLTQRKGHLYLLEALDQLRQHHDDFHLDIVGDGEFRSVIESRIAGLGLKEHVTLHGRVPKPAVAEHMRQADVFVLPSLYETQGCVLFEALASGIPVVATKVGGIPETVRPEHGVLVPPADPTALCAAIEEIFQTQSAYDPKTLSDYANGHFARAVVGARYEAIYRQVLAEWAQGSGASK